RSPCCVARSRASVNSRSAAAKSAVRNEASVSASSAAAISARAGRPGGVVMNASLGLAGHSAVAGLEVIGGRVRGFRAPPVPLNEAWLKHFKTVEEPGDLGPAAER